jgi:hypothetical protein
VEARSEATRKWFMQGPWMMQRMRGGCTAYLHPSSIHVVVMVPPQGRTAWTTLRSHKVSPDAFLPQPQVEKWRIAGTWRTRRGIWRLR